MQASHLLRVGKTREYERLVVPADTAQPELHRERKSSNYRTAGARGTPRNAFRVNCISSISENVA